MFSRKQIITLIIALAILAALAVGAVLYVQFMGPISTNTNQETNENTNTGNTNNTNGTTGSLNTNVQPLNVNSNMNENTNTEPVEEVDEQASVLRLTKIFIERYGSFSNRNNFENITNLEPLMTEKFRQKSAKFIDENQAAGIDEEYYGITTTAASMNVTAYVEDASATVDVATRRVESKANEDPRIFSQNVIVSFKKVEGSWKVSDVQWQ